MIGNLFKKTTPEDILKALKDKTFKETKINALLQNIDINLKFSNGDNLLHRIVPLNNIESVKSLITHGINLNSKNFSGDTALHIAAKYDYYDTLLALLEAKADTGVLNEQNRLAIQEAISTGKFENYKLLCKYMESFNYIEENGNSLLKDAINANNIEIFDDLIKNKNILLDKDILFFEKVYNNSEIFHHIIKYFNDISILNDDGKNILFF